MHLKKFALAAAALLLSAGTAAAAVVTGDLNLRAGPGTGYGVIDTMPAGARVNVLRCGGAWCHVAWEGTVGYASRSYLAGGGYGFAPPPVYAYASGPYYDYGPGPVFGFGFGFGGGWHHHWHHWHH